MAEKLTFNPELVLACARLARPDLKWEELLNNNGHLIGFDPLNNPADHDALVEALLKQGWKFSRTDWPGHERYVAERKFYAGSGESNLVEVRNESRPICTLKAVAAQTGIPLEGR